MSAGISPASVANRNTTMLDLPLAQDEPNPATKELAEFLRAFSASFRRRDQARLFEVYVRGLLHEGSRKSIESMVRALQDEVTSPVRDLSQALQHVRLLNDDEWDGGHDVQSDDGHVQVRNDRGRHEHDVYERRQGLLRHDSSVLRLHGNHDESVLHLLHDDEQHAGVLLLLIVHSFPARDEKKAKPSGPSAAARLDILLRLSPRHLGR
jgi:hypothetical protein